MSAPLENEVRALQIMARLSQPTCGENSRPGNMEIEEIVEKTKPWLRNYPRILLPANNSGLNLRALLIERGKVFGKFLLNKTSIMHRIYKNCVIVEFYIMKTFFN